MPSPLTAAHIESVIATMPIQGRIMMRLLLLQYMDVTQEEIEYMTADRPDPRCVSGTKPTSMVLTREALKAVSDRRDQYRRQVRLRRERTWLQCDCLKKLGSVCDSLAARAALLLTGRFGATEEEVAELRAKARAAVPKPAIRLLDERWAEDAIAAEDYQRQRLGVEMQTQLRLAEKHRRRLDISERERQAANAAPLQDHEIGHIWGIPAGSLAARKVKYITQYLQALQAKLQSDQVSGAGQPPLDLWKETFAVLAAGPIERSVSHYDGLERTETALIDKLTVFAWGALPEEVEAKFWLSLMHGASSNAMHAEETRSLFGLHRLAAILNDMDTSPEALDEELLKRTAPKPKEDPLALTAPEPISPSLREGQEQILRNFFGEDVR